MAKFWTDRSLLPYQKHNFKVQLELFHIAGFNQSKAAIQSNAAIAKSSIHRPIIPSYFIKSVDLPKFSTSIENNAGNFAPNSNIEAEAGDFEDLTITFHVVNNIAELIPSIFYAYYLQFNANGQAPLPFIQKKSKLGAKFNTEFVKNSSIIVTLLNNNNPVEIKYASVLPISYDIGSLDYGDSGLVEATMTFSYNVRQGARRTGISGTP
jgi:hypothetical protein